MAYAYEQVTYIRNALFTDNPEVSNMSTIPYLWFPRYHSNLGVDVYVKFCQCW